MIYIVKILIGISLLLTAIWLPCYIGGELLPGDWLTENLALAHKYWWEFPALLTLIGGGIAVGVLGIVIIIAEVAD